MALVKVTMPDSVKIVKIVITKKTEAEQVFNFYVEAFRTLNISMNTIASMWRNDVRKNDVNFVIFPF